MDGFVAIIFFVSFNGRNIQINKNSRTIMYKYFILTMFFVCAAVSCNNKKTTNTSTENMSLADSLELAMESISDENSLYLIVGTYTSGDSEGIYVYQFDTVSGYSKPVSNVKIDNPSYLVLTKDEKYIYAVTENDDNSSAASAYSFDKKTGTLNFLNTQYTGGGAPCYITVDDAGKHVITANYLGGSITVFNTKEGGALDVASQVISFSGKGIDPQRQTAPHIHCVHYTPDGRYLYATDLGTDKIHKFAVNENDLGNHLKSGIPPFFKVADGSGPRHLEFHPDGKYAYLITEMAGDVIAFNYSDGNLTPIQTIKADTLNAQGSGDIHISPDGNYLYASNRLKGDGIAIFSIDRADGRLVKVGYQETGIHPRNFVITPNGKYLLVGCRDSDVIQIFARDQKTGLLENTFKDIKLDMPVCLKFASMK